MIVDVLLQQCAVQCLPQEDFWTAFWKSPGAGGLGAVIAAAIAALVTWAATHSIRKGERAKLAQEKTDKALERCWERFAWAVAAKEEEVPEYVRTELLRRLEIDARRLGDETLPKLIEDFNQSILDRVDAIADW
ncbi:hypothetical protein [Rhodococcus sp. T7]|uniref:hypothetical protein n=1 Tax=Rhodococcus sp. T7 TaxID=627444 RepID=UPI00135A0F81|nr:hypothetical protein [Rhodococcus sp. T7]KAF0966413.1 hypothetical protein MLGJGCBP_00432 [Rhodococcus sp. T7]